jgi:hypothetical protein
LCGIRKKLDPLETYVPTVVLAQRQFEDVGIKLFYHQLSPDPKRKQL